MYLWDANILRHFGEGHPHLRLFLERIPWAEIALPSVVVAEVLRGRCEFALKADPQQAPFAHTMLMQTQRLLSKFNVIVFDQKSAEALERLQKKHKAHKWYADMMIAAIAQAGNHIVVTRNLQHFEILLPKQQLVNWIDDIPSE
jgi:predicted nucleic acid-binding protein